tara:strand:- start:71 stop:586 length:516 start_codon:yes stop_codon:yes gene_type:complete
MTLIALTTFIQVLDKDGNVQSDKLFQNGKTDGSISTNLGSGTSRSYKYLSFLYQGAVVTNNGDNLQASLILANKISDTSPANKLSMNYAIEALQNKERVNVYVCRMNDDFTAIQGLPITSDSWQVSSMGYDAETIQVVLSSGIDAVGGNTGKYLSRQMVGDLPVTGRIASR